MLKIEVVEKDNIPENSFEQTINFLSDSSNVLCSDPGYAQFLEMLHYLYDSGIKSYDKITRFWDETNLIRVSAQTYDKKVKKNGQDIQLTFSKIEEGTWYDNKSNPYKGEYKFCYTLLDGAIIVIEWYLDNFVVHFGQICFNFGNEIYYELYLCPWNKDYYQVIETDNEGQKYLIGEINASEVNQAIANYRELPNFAKSEVPKKLTYTPAYSLQRLKPINK